MPDSNAEHPVAPNAKVMNRFALTKRLVAKLSELADQSVLRVLEMLVVL